MGRRSSHLLLYVIKLLLAQTPIFIRRARGDYSGLAFPCAKNAQYHHGPNTGVPIQLPTYEPLHPYKSNATRNGRRQHNECIDAIAFGDIRIASRHQCTQCEYHHEASEEPASSPERCKGANRPRKQSRPSGRCECHETGETPPSLEHPLV